MKLSFELCHLNLWNFKQKLNYLMQNESKKGVTPLFSEIQPHWVAAAVLFWLLCKNKRNLPDALDNNLTMPEIKDIA